MDPDVEFCLSFSDIVENMHLIAINKFFLTHISFFGVGGHFNIALESTGPESWTCLNANHLSQSQSSSVGTTSPVPRALKFVSPKLKKSWL